MSETHYDAAIIGAGMSGLAAAVRLSMYGRKVLVLERHNAPGASIPSTRAGVASMTSACTP